MTLPRDGWLELVGIQNGRDLGWLSGPGVAVREGALFRSGTPQDATADDVRLLIADLGVRTLVDLRTHDEVLVEGVGLLGDAQVDYHHFPFADRDHLTAHLVPGAEGVDLVAFYLELLDRAGDAVVRTARALAEPTCGPTLIFCAAGKDRTGVVTAVLLDAVGVDHAEIARDYARTGQRIEGIREHLSSLASYRHISGVDQRWMRADAAVMSDFLARLQERTGGGAGWLRSRGLVSSELVGLRRMLTVNRH